MSKRLFGCLAMAVIAAAGAPTWTRAQALTPENIVAKSLQALGGAEALGKLTSRRATGRVTISTPAGDVSGPIEILSKAPNKVRASMTMDLSAMGGGQVEIVQRFDGTTASQSNSMQGETDITGTELEYMRNQTFPTPLLRYKENGVTLALLPNDTIDGQAVLVVQMTPKVGPPVKVYFDPKTYLPVRTFVHVNSAALGGDVDRVSDTSDYRDVSGVKVPFRLVGSTGGQTLTIVFDTVQDNVPIEDSVFSK